MIEPFRKDDEFLANLEEPLPEGALRVWWLGQSGYLLKYAGRCLLLDPYLSDSLTLKYAATDKPHARMTQRVVAPERLAGIDVITSSHNHTDHLDADTLLPIIANNPGVQFVIPKANRTFVSQRLGTPREWPVGLNDGTSATVGGFEFHGIAAAHNELDRDSEGNHLYLGYVIRCGEWTLYHSGDTLIYAGLAERLQRFGRIDLATLPINGNRPERRVAGNFDGREAAQLAHAAGVGRVIPCHYDMFEFNMASPDELFIPECEALRQAYSVLRAGESLTLGT